MHERCYSKWEGLSGYADTWRATWLRNFSTKVLVEEEGFTMKSFNHYRGEGVPLLIHVYVPGFPEIVEVFFEKYDDDWLSEFATYNDESIEFSRCYMNTARALRKRFPTKQSIMDIIEIEETS